MTSTLKALFGRLLLSAALLFFLMTGLSVGTAETTGGSIPQVENSRFFEWRPFLAPFHSVVLHLPIGFFLIAFLLEVYSLKRPSAELRRAIGFVLAFSVASAAITIALGLLRGTSGEYAQEMLNRHKWFGVAVGGISVVALFFHWLAVRTGERRGLLWCYRLIALANLGVLLIAGHEGGNLTHGSAYLVKNAPEFVKSFLEEFEDTELEPQPVSLGMNEGRREYLEKIRPLLESKCLSCHGAEKQKGGYRLDQREFAISGGDSGEPAIEPGEPLRSHLIQLVLLPADHDDVMPPSGKGRLSNEEIMTLIRWIQNGANFGENPVSVPDPAETVETKAELQPDRVTAVADTPVTAVAPETKSIRQRPASKFAERVDFIHDIKPILETHCVSCHGPSKQKSRLRLDQKQFALGGGRHGKIISPGHADESELYLRVSVLRDRDSEERIMPPEHKDVPLTHEEIAALGNWINSGAFWPDGVDLTVPAATVR